MSSLPEQIMRVAPFTHAESGRPDCVLFHGATHRHTLKKKEKKDRI